MLIRYEIRNTQKKLIASGNFDSQDNIAVARFYSRAAIAWEDGHAVVTGMAEIFSAEG